MEIEIWACCYSEKADVSISFGTSIESTHGDLSDLDTEWIYEGMGDSFWENHEEFEEGIAQARTMSNEDCSVSFREALFSVFGHFGLEFEVNGKITNLNSEIDVDEFMYKLLEI